MVNFGSAWARIHAQTVWPLQHPQAHKTTGGRGECFFSLMEVVFALNTNGGELIGLFRFEGGAPFSTMKAQRCSCY